MRETTDVCVLDEAGLRGKIPHEVACMATVRLQSACFCATAREYYPDVILVELDIASVMSSGRNSDYDDQGFFAAIEQMSALNSHAPQPCDSAKLDIQHHLLGDDVIESCIPFTRPY